MGLGCPECGTLDGDKHTAECTWVARHPTVGHIVIYEYAGFEYSITHLFEKPHLKAVPLPGQHPHAAKERHIRAALVAYMEDFNAGRLSTEARPPPSPDEAE